MSKYFTSSPYEREMMKVPCVINNESERQKLRKGLSYHESCKSCLSYSQGKDKCKRNACPYIAERIEQNAITVLELIHPLIFEARDESYYKRLIRIYKEIHGGKITTMYKSKPHERVFKKWVQLYKKQGYILSSRFTAALFVLSADKFLWDHSKYHIKPNAIDFDNIDIKGIEPDAYLLYKVAKDFTFKTTNVSTSELADRLITKETIFTVVLNGILIARYGIDTLKLELIPKSEEKI